MAFPGRLLKVMERDRKFGFHYFPKSGRFFHFPKELSQNQLDISDLNEIFDLRKTHQISTNTSFSGRKFGLKMAKITRQVNV